MTVKTKKEAKELGNHLMNAIKPNKAIKDQIKKVNAYIKKYQDALKELKSVQMNILKKQRIFLQII